MDVVHSAQMNFLMDGFTVFQVCFIKIVQFKQFKCSVPFEQSNRFCLLILATEKYLHVTISQRHNVNIGVIFACLMPYKSCSTRYLDLTKLLILDTCKKCEAKCLSKSEFSDICVYQTRWISSKVTKIQFPCLCSSCKMVVHKPKDSSHTRIQVIHSFSL